MCALGLTVPSGEDLKCLGSHITLGISGLHPDGAFSAGEEPASGDQAVIPIAKIRNGLISMLLDGDLRNVLVVFHENFLQPRIHQKNIEEDVHEIVRDAEG